MNISNKKQVAGDESSQFQAETINQTNNVTIVNNGVSVSDVIALFKQQFRLALSDFGNIAEQKANERISKFEEEFFSKIANSDISLDSFKKPELHVFLSDACKSAIQSDSNNDYKLLSELLIKRIKEDNNRKICAGLKFATQIIPELDKDSLFGLTISFVFLKLVASADNPIDALRILDSIYGSLMYQEIPKSNNWIGLLDMLRCVRIVNFSKAKPYINTFCDQYDGFCCVGIKSQSPEYENIRCHRRIQVL